MKCDDEWVDYLTARTHLQKLMLGRQAIDEALAHSSGTNADNLVVALTAIDEAITIATEEAIDAATQEAARCGGSVAAVLSGIPSPKPNESGLHPRMMLPETTKRVKASR